MRKVAIVLALVGLMFAGGCAYVPPGDQLVIHSNNLNAQAINAKVQASPTAPAVPDGTLAPVPAYVKVWWAAEAKTWTAMEAWSKGQKFPATAPAESR